MYQQPPQQTGDHSVPSPQPAQQAGVQSVPSPQPVQQAGVQRVPSQQPAQQAGVQSLPSHWQPAVGSPQGYGPSAQPVTYQMSPGQPQPVMIGQSNMGQQGQPLQYYAPTGQPVQPAQFQVAPAQPPVDEDEDITTIKINKAYLKSGLNGSRIFEFIFLSIAWPCVVVYSYRAGGFDGRANFFKDVTIFCWVMVILFQIVFLCSINRNKRYFRQPSYCTLVSLGIQVVLTILLITCTVSFSIRLVDLNKVYKDFGSYSLPGSTLALIFGAEVFGVLASISFLDDIRLLSGMYSRQRSKEVAAASATFAGAATASAASAAAGFAQQPAGTYPQQQVGTPAQFPPQSLVTQK